MKKQFKFEGRGGEIFSLYLVQFLLTLITLGIYAPWAYAKIYKYFATKTSLDGKPFDFTGTGGEMFSLFLVQFLLTMITFGIYGAWAFAKIVKYMLSKFTYDGIH
ncbi:hypothetical protein MASR2M78_01010 [Treponema sp.]